MSLLRGKRSPGFWIFALAIFVFWVSLYVYVPVLPVYATTFHGSTLQVTGFVVAAYGLSQLLLRIPLGLLSDRLDRRKFFFAAGLFFSLVSGIGMALTKTSLGLIFFRGVSGIAAASWVATTVLFANYFEAGSSVKAAGQASSLSALGQLTGTLLGGFIAQEYGWQAPFLAGAGLAGGALLFLFFFGENRQPKKGAVSSPRANFMVLTDRSLLIVSLAAAVGQYVAYATTYGFVPVLASQIGASRAALGGLTGSMQLAYMATSLLVGLVATSRSEKTLAFIGMVLIGLSSFWVLRSSTVNTLLWTRVLHGVGHGLSYPVLMGLAIIQVPGRQRASAMGVFQAVYALGMVTGPAVSGYVAKHAGLPWVFTSSGWVILLTIPLLIWGLNSSQTKQAELVEM